MNILSRSGFIAGTMLLIVVAIAPPRALAQMGQQQMNDDARRMQQNDPYGQQNAPVQGQSPTPSYQRAPAQMARRLPGTQVDATAATATAEWVSASGYQEAGAAVYAARSTIRRSGNLVKMWDMYDFKTARAFEGKQYFSLKNQMDYDCKEARGRLLSTTAFSGHMGKGNVVISDTPSRPTWEPIRPGSRTFAEALAKIACAGK